MDKVTKTSTVIPAKIEMFGDSSVISIRVGDSSIEIDSQGIRSGLLYLMALAVENDELPSYGKDISSLIHNIESILESLKKEVDKVRFKQYR